MNKYYPVVVVALLALPLPISFAVSAALAAFNFVKEGQHALFFGVYAVWTLKLLFIPPFLVHWIVYDLVSYAIVMCTFLVSLKDESTLNLKVLLYTLLLFPGTRHVLLDVLRAALYVFLYFHYEQNPNRALLSAWVLACVSYVVALYLFFLAYLAYSPAEKTPDQIVQTVKKRSKPKQEDPITVFTCIGDANDDFDFDASQFD